MKGKSPVVFVLLITLIVSQFFVFGSVTNNDETYAASPTSWDSVPTNEWMKYVDGNRLINNINIPGTHDSATQYVTESFKLGATCQYYDIFQQLEDGVRFLDIRLRNENGKMRLVHGDIDCLVNEGSSSHLTFEKVLQWVDAFLFHNPSETVIMSIEENGTSTDKDHTFDNDLYNNYIKNSSVKWETGRTAKPLKDVRGKVVLLSRYGDNERGLDFKKWSSGKNVTFSAGGGTAHVQDWYSITAFQRDDKWNVVTKMAVRCENKEYDKDSEYVINYTSATDGIPENVADYMNEKVRRYSWKTGVKYGWIPMDFVNTSLTKTIYKTNEFVGEPDDINIKNVEYGKDDIVISGDFSKRDDGFNRTGNVLVLDYFASDYQGESFVENDIHCKGTVKYTIKDNSDKFTLKFPKSQIYPIPYMTRLREETPSGVLQSGIEPSYINADHDAYYNYPQLILPDWIKAQDETVRMNIDYYSGYHYDSTEYSILENYTPVATSAGTEFDIRNYKYNVAYNASVYNKFLKEKNLYDLIYSPGFFFKPKILGIPTDLDITNLTYDSADLSWDFVGTATNSSVTCDKFKVTVTNTNTDDEIVQYVSKNENSATFIGLDALTEYEAVVTAMGGEVENTSDAMPFATEEAPALYVTPILNYLGHVSPAMLTAKLFQTGLSNIEYHWYGKERGSQTQPSLISPITGNAVNYEPEDSKVMEVFSTANWTTGSGPDSATSNKVLVYKDPSTPSAFTVNDQGLTWLNLSWDMTDSDDITGFEIEYDDTTITVPPGERSVTISGLEPGEDYSLELRALGLGSGKHQAKSDVISTTGTTLAKAAPPENASISRTPEETAPFEQDIEYKATCTAVDNGQLSYQWRINTGSGIFTDIAGATGSAYTLTPSKDNFGNEIYCAITNTLNGTSATALTMVEYVTFKASVVTEINAEPTPSRGAVSADLTWENPDIFGYYIISAKPTSSGGISGFAADSAGDANALGTNSAIRYLVKGEGASGDTMHFQIDGLTPATKYDIRIENIMRDPVTDELLPADMNGILTTNITTLEGAVAPIITDDPVPTTSAFKGDSVTFSATGKVSPTGSSIYRWSEMKEDLSKRETLSGGTMSGIQKLSSNITASSEKAGNYYYLQIMSTNNGDTKVASSQASKLVLLSDDDEGNDGKNNNKGDDNNGRNKDAEDSATGDQTALFLWIIGILLAVSLLGLLIKIVRKAE